MQQASSGKHAHGSSRSNQTCELLAAPIPAIAALLITLALAGCGGGDPDSSASAQTNAEPRKSATATAPPGAGQWSNLIHLSLVPAAAANLPNGRVVLWSSETRFSFSATWPDLHDHLRSRHQPRDRDACEQYGAQHVLPRYQQPARRPIAGQRRHRLRQDEHLQPGHEFLVDRRDDDHPAGLPGQLRARGRVGLHPGRFVVRRRGQQARRGLDRSQWMAPAHWRSDRQHVVCRSLAQLRRRQPFLVVPCTQRPRVPRGSGHQHALAGHSGRWQRRASRPAR